MAKGWEVAIRVQDNFTGWGSSTGVTANPGHFLFVDSETLARNAVIKERDEKIIPMRLAPVQTVSLEQYSPGGEITFQPRTNDCLSILFSHFQAGSFRFGNAATAQLGTWQFTAVGKSLTWSGVAFATTSVFPINVEKYFGEGLSGTLDGIRFERGVVTKLTLDQSPSEDLKMTAEMRFLQHVDETVLGTGFKSQPNSLGSFSTKKQLVDWNGTLTVGGNSYAIERIRMEFDNVVTERRKLGQKGFYQFPFGRAVHMGEFDLELEDLNALKQATTAGTLNCRWQTEDGDWINIFQPNIYIKAYDNNVSDTGPVMRTIPYRAYPTSFGGSNASVIEVYPQYGTGALPVEDELYF